MTQRYMNVDDVLASLIYEIEEEGDLSGDRTGVGTKRIFGWTGKLWAGTELLVPVIKPVNIRAVLAEFWCFTNGITNVDELKAHGCNWWEANLQDANKRWGTPDNRDLGPVYGAQWVKPYEGAGGAATDQLTNLIKTIKDNPTDRRMYVTAWNPEDFDRMALPPCYHGFQVFVNNGRLDIMWHMRSCDVILGLPHDILFHQFLMMALAAECGLSVGDMTITLGDTHLYQNAREPAQRMKANIAKEEFLNTRRPVINMRGIKGFRDVHPDRITYLFDGEYLHFPRIHVDMAV